MFYLLLIIPILTLILGLILYRFTGSRQFLQLDLIQFIQAFIYMPIILIWSKSFLYFILSNEIDIRFSPRDYIFFDTALSVILFYIFAFVVLHSLTKTFSLRKQQDPLVDLFEISEYFHLRISHIIMYGGAVVIFTFFSFLNLLVPLSVELSKTAFLGIIFTGIFCGVVSFLTILNYNPEDIVFMKIIKLFVGGSTVLHSILFLLIDTTWSGTHSLYWFIFMIFLTTSTCLLFTYRSRKAKNIAEKLLNIFT